jgi:hypothetical protein
MSITNYRQRAEECRRLADLRAGTDDWAAFLEMAETWERLAALHEYSQQLKSSGVLLTKPIPSGTKPLNLPPNSSGTSQHSLAAESFHKTGSIFDAEPNVYCV